MASLSKDPRRLFERIAADLRAQVMAGALPPGSKLPSTSKLMDLYETNANQVVQDAISLLKREGYLTGKVGSGTYVRDEPQRAIVPAAYIAPADPGEPYPWVSEASRTGRRGTSKILAVSEVQATPNVAAALGLQAGGLVVMRVRLMLLDGEPAELVHSYYPADIAGGTALADRKAIKGGAPRVLAEAGFPQHSFVDRVSTRMPTSSELLVLGLPHVVPVLRTFRVIYTEAGRPIEATEMVKAGHLYELEYRQRTE